MSNNVMALPAEPSLSMPYSTVAQEVPKYTLFRGSTDGTCHASSPFVTKVEFRLRLAGISYSIDGGAPWLGPKGKIPYLQLSPCTSSKDPTKPLGKGVSLGDSSLIIKHLMECDSLGDLHETLDPSEKAKDLALRALLEDKLYFYHMRECWVDNYYAQRDQALSGVPFPVRYFVGQVVYQKVVRTLFGQGTGRYDSEEVQFFREEIWSSINDLLSAPRMIDSGTLDDEPYWCLGGPGPTEADTTLYGFISSILTGTSCPTSSALLRSLPAIMDYADRIHKKYFPDYAQWQTSDKALVTDAITVLAKL